jgi:CHAT domain-containing protein
LPWSALVDYTGAYLVLSHRLTLLTSGRDLLRLGAPEGDLGPALVIGAPTYDGLPSKPTTPSSSDDDRAPNQRRNWGPMGRPHFKPLPWTEGEARQIAELWPGTTPYLGAQASEAMVKRVHRPRIVHLATHGFLLAPPADGGLPRNARGITLEMPADLPPSGSPWFDPLLLSGVALAGANVPGPRADDGLLMATEIMAIDLGGTELVVLSACDTGRGVPVDGEGLYGLRRALVLAGSQSQMLSLWNVQDDTTARFMIAVHKSLVAGASRADALRDVQLQVLADQATSHPFFWAPFFLQGNPSSLDGKPARPLVASPGESR